MKKRKIFIAIDTTKINQANEIIKKTKSSKIVFGYKFGLEFINSINGRKFLSKFKKSNNFC